MFQPEYFTGRLQDISNYLQKELERFRLHLIDGNEQVVIISPSYKEPEKPRDGMVVYADGTEWEPDGAGGEGFYGYYGTAWHKLG